MIEDPVPLELPPGFRNNGTTYQSKGRWFTGQLVRFFQKKIQPVGGWVQRTLTGATISGTPSAAISWQKNDGTSLLAIGTTSGLWVVVSNVVTNITPTTFGSGGASPRWQLDTFGAYLVAVYNGTGSNPSGAVNLYYWTGDTSTLAQPVQALVLDAPYLGFGVVTTPERFLVMLRGSDPAVLGGTAGMKTFRAARGGSVAAEMVD